MSDDPYRPRSRAKRFKSSTIVGMITTFVMFVALALMMSTYSDSAPDATLPATLPVTLESTSETPEPEKPAESVTERHRASGYPADMQDAAVKPVPGQAELLSGE